MARKIYLGVGDNGKNITSTYASMFVGVNGEAKKVRRVYVGVNGHAKICYPDITNMVVNYTNNGSYYGALENGALLWYSRQDVLGDKVINLSSNFSGSLLIDKSDTTGYTFFNVTPSSYKSYAKFTSSNPSVLSVDSATGSLTPVSAGTANIIFESEEKKIIIPFRVINTTYTPVTGFHFVYGHVIQNHDIHACIDAYDRASHTYLSFSSSDYAPSELRNLTSQEKSDYIDASFMPVQQGEIYRISIPNLPNTLTSVTNLYMEYFYGEDLTTNVTELDYKLFGGNHKVGSTTKKYNTGNPTPAISKTNETCFFVRVPSGMNKMTMQIKTDESGSTIGNITSDVCTWLNNNVTIEKLTYTI